LSAVTSCPVTTTTTTPVPTTTTTTTINYAVEFKLYYEYSCTACSIGSTNILNDIYLSSLACTNFNNACGLNSYSYSSFTGDLLNVGRTSCTTGITDGYYVGGGTLGVSFPFLPSGTWYVIQMSGNTIINKWDCGDITTTTTTAPTTTTTTTALVISDLGQLGFNLFSGNTACGMSSTFGIFGNQPSFSASTLLYSDISGVTSAPEGYYSDGYIYKYWDSTGITLSGTCPITTTTTTTAATTTTTTTTAVTGTTFSILVIAGGGAGGYNGHGASNGGGGGGGAGGFIFQTGVTLSGSYAIQVGSGGTASNGQDSLFGNLYTAVGGGEGGNPEPWETPTNNRGKNGGSGGGTAASIGSYYQVSSGTTGQGYGGGDAFISDSQPAGGGGGGAGEKGGSGSGPTNQGGDGGSGRTCTIYDDTTRWYCGGGGGSRWDPGNRDGYGGIGGGGAGVRIGTGVSGQTNSGGGGGAGYPAGAGGSGIVIVRYSGSQIATGGTITTVSGDTVHTFTSSGTFAIT